jgi:hypothetical protein
MRWQDREAERFLRGEYQEIPDCGVRNRILTRYPHHFPHVCKEDSSLIEFIVHPDKGEKEQYTRMKPGKYLKKYCDWLDDDDIEEYTVDWTAETSPLPLYIAETGDEAEEITVNGPNTCMGNSHWDSGVHPHQVYDLSHGSDLTIACIGEPSDARAFAIVYPAKKIFSTYYGDDRIQASLLAAGYTYDDQKHSWAGAKICRIESEGYTVLPYIDQVSHVDEQEDFLVLAQGYGEHSCKETDGALNLEHCCKCDHNLSDGESMHHNGETYCEECFLEDYSSCDYCGKYHYCEDSVRIESGPNNKWERWFCSYCAESDAIRCEHDDLYYLKQDAIEIRDGDGDATGEYIAIHNVKDSNEYFLCSIDGEVYPIEFKRVIEEGKAVHEEYARKCEGFGLLWFHVDNIVGRYSKRWLAQFQLELPF